MSPLSQSVCPFRKSTILPLLSRHHEPAKQSPVCHADQDQDQDQDSIRQPSSKRRRVALACQSCRERKVRCDGLRPVCSTCNRRGISTDQCEYLVIADTAKYQTERAYVQMLKEQISYLQQSTSQCSDLRPSQISTPASSSATDQLAQTTIANVASSTPAPSVSRGEIESPLSPRSELMQHQQPRLEPTISNVVNAMGAAIPDVCDVRSPDEYYGQSSLVSFIQQCTTHPSSHHKSGRGPPSRSTQPITPSAASTTLDQYPLNPIKMQSYVADDFSLPPRQVADWLLEIYFKTSHIFYPWVHKETFMTGYEQLWSGNYEETPNDLPDMGLGGPGCSMEVFHCALNAIFAIACEFSNMAVKEKRSSSSMFYDRMKSLMNIDILDSGNLAHVQALLLVSLYLQCTPYPRRCWNAVGMAYRVAVGIGLHLSRRCDDSTPLEREIRWRVWCACVQMDIMVSMTMGRPSMTRLPCEIPLPSPVDDSFLSAGTQSDAQSQAGTISHNQFVYENMRLIGILGSILSTIYYSTETDSGKASLQLPPSDGQAVVNIERALEGFQSSLHPGLRWDSNQVWSRTMDPIYKRLSNSLHTRYLHLKLLLYRPGFIAYCFTTLSKRGRNRDGTRQADDDPISRPDSWSELGQRYCAEGCVLAACELIESLSKAIVQDYTGAWWYGIFYLISAGVILIAVETNGMVIDDVNSQRRDEAWDSCLQTLFRMVDVHPSARDFAIALNDLKQQREHPTQPGERAGETGADTSQDGDAAHPVACDISDRSNWYYSASITAPSSLLQGWDFGLDDLRFPHFLPGTDEGFVFPNLSSVV